MKTIDEGHVYELGNHVDHKAEPQIVRFVKKAAKEPGGDLELVHDGTTTEQVIDMLINRLGYLYAQLPDPYTKAARYFLGQVANALQERSNDRKARGVEGTNKA